MFYHGFRHSGTSDGDSDIGTAMEKQLADLNGKVKTLDFRINKTNEILDKNDRLAAERQKPLLENMTEAGRSLASNHFICFLTTWITVDNSGKCIFVLIFMLGRVKNI